MRDGPPRNARLRRAARVGPAAENILDRLHAEADAEDRQFYLERGPMVFEIPKSDRPPGPGDQHQKIVFCAEHRKEREVPDPVPVKPRLPEIIRQNLHEM